MDFSALKNIVNGDNITNKGNVIGNFKITKRPYQSGAYTVIDIVTIADGVQHTVITNRNIEERIKQVDEYLRSNGMSETMMHGVEFNFKKIVKKKDGKDYYMLEVV